MIKNYDIRELGGDKVALLCLFALSLLTARFVVGLKSAIILSDPIPLEGTGISVAVPIGNGWQSNANWVYEGRNTVVLKSSFSAVSGQPTAGVICQYQPAVRTRSLRMLFEKKARNYNGEIVSIDRIVTDSLTFDWAQIKGENPLITAFLGTAVLSEDWQFDIEVFDVTGNVEQAEEAFRQIINSVKFENVNTRTALIRS